MGAQLRLGQAHRCDTVTAKQVRSAALAVALPVAAWAALAVTLQHNIGTPPQPQPCGTTDKVVIHSSALDPFAMLSYVADEQGWAIAPLLAPFYPKDL